MDIVMESDLSDHIPVLNLQSIADFSLAVAGSGMSIGYRADWIVRHDHCAVVRQQHSQRAISVHSARSDE